MKKQSFFSSLTVAAKGFWTTAIAERNIRIQAGVGMITITLGIFFGLTILEWVSLLFAIALVIGFELVNSAFEVMVDWISPEFHPLAGKVKDVAAGAVFFVSIISVVVGVLIFLPYVLQIIN